MRLGIRIAIGLGAILALGPACARTATAPPEPNVLSAEERSAGWMLLFDGASTRGWHRYGGAGVDPRWAARDGELRLTRGGAGDLESDARFDSFELSFDWKIAPKGNSGVIYRVAAGAGRAWQSGPEYQLLDDRGVAEAPVHQAAALYDLYAPPRHLAKPAGEWNQARIVVRGDAVEHWLNGQRAVSVRFGSPEFAAAVAASKFARYPGWGKAPGGSIVLQDHGSPVAFRNLKIRRLDVAPGR